MLVPDKDFIKIKCGIDVAVPASNGLTTPFVLKEQGDWFEDEIRFIRRYIQPHMRILDIGANYGLYTLSMAQLATKGSIWAFEPTPAVMECLRDSIARNQFTNVQPIQAGLSNRDGQAKLALNNNPELNSIQEVETKGGNYETIELKTIDACAEELSWQDLDFIKLDAEGEELRILEGGESTLRKLSPVIMYELKHVEKVNFSLIEKLETYGYQSYYLLPGPMVLLPFDSNHEVDPFQLNLFAIKDESVDELEARGLMSKHHPELHTGSALPKVDHDLWKTELEKKAFSSPFIDTWKQLDQENKDNAFWGAYIHVFNLFTHYLYGNASPQQGVEILFHCDKELRHLKEQNDVFPISILHCRILFALGKRAEAVKTLGALISQATSGANIGLDFPFYPADERYDEIDPSSNLSNWIFSALLEPFETKKTFSSYFIGKSAQQNLQVLNDLGFCDAGIARRIELLNFL